MRKINLGKKYKVILLAVVAIVFLAIPLPAADLYINIYFEKIAGQQCVLFYATDTANFSEEQSIVAAVDTTANSVTFRLDGSLEKHLVGLRLDFPAQEDLVGIKTITVSSGGVIQEEYNPCHFLAESNIQLVNDADVTLVRSSKRAYVATEAKDPYIILSKGLTEEVSSQYSHYTLTRVGICLLFAAGCFLTKKNVFNTK